MSYIPRVYYSVLTLNLIGRNGIRWRPLMRPNGRLPMLHRLMTYLGIRRSQALLKSHLLAIHILRTTYP